MSLPFFDSLTGVLALLVTGLAGALAIILKMFGQRGDKLRDTQEQLDAAAEHLSRQKAVQARIDKTEQEAQQQEDAAVKKVREGRRDHFENQP